MTFRRGLHWLALATLLGSGCDKTLSFDVPAEENGGEPGSGGVAGGGLGGNAGSLIGQAGGDEPHQRAGGPNKDPPPANGGATFMSDEDCVAFCADVGQRCDRSEYRCVECFDDDDCPAERYCDRGLNRCVTCVGDRGCPREKVCDSTNQCQEPCLTPSHPDADCHDSTQMCVDEINRCVACRGDADCTATPERPFCLESGSRCAECEGDFHCSKPKQHCDPVLFKCVECTDSRQCELPLVCHPEAHVCSDPRFMFPI